MLKQVVLELDWEEGLRNYTFQAVEGSDSWAGNPRIDVIFCWMMKIGNPWHSPPL